MMSFYNSKLYLAFLVLISGYAEYSMARLFYDMYKHSEITGFRFSGSGYFIAFFAVSICLLPLVILEWFWVSIYFLASKPLIILDEDKMKWRKGNGSAYSEMYYLNILKMYASGNPAGGRYINIVEKDSQIIRINISFLKAGSKSVFEQIIKFRSDLKPVGGWDWSNIQ